MSARPVLAVIAVVVVAAVSALALGSGSASHAAGGTISLPNSLPGYRDYVAALAAKNKNKKMVATTRREQAIISSHTIAQYRQAFHGAPVAFHAYANAGLSAFPWVIAVGANAPGVTVGPYEDAKYLGLAIAERFVQRFGDVECAIDSGSTTPAGHKPDLSQEVAAVCQRTAHGVTVMTGGGGFEGPGGLRRLVALTDAAGQAVRG